MTAAVIRKALVAGVGGTLAVLLVDGVGFTPEQAAPILDRVVRVLEMLPVAGGLGSLLGWLTWRVPNAPDPPRLE